MNLFSKYNVRFFITQTLWMMVIKYISVMTVVHFIVRHMQFNRFLHPNEVFAHFIVRQIKFNRFSHSNEVSQRIYFTHQCTYRGAFKTLKSCLLLKHPERSKLFLSKDMLCSFALGITQVLCPKPEDDSCTGALPMYWLILSMITVRFATEAPRSRPV